MLYASVFQASFGRAGLSLHRTLTAFIYIYIYIYIYNCQLRLTSTLVANVIWSLGCCILYVYIYVYMWLCLCIYTKTILLFVYVIYGLWVLNQRITTHEPILSICKYNCNVFDLFHILLYFFVSWEPICARIRWMVIPDVLITCSAVQLLINCSVLRLHREIMESTKHCIVDLEANRCMTSMWVYRKRIKVETRI